MISNSGAYSDRAVQALHSLVGGVQGDMAREIGIPAAVYIPSARLIIAAGDHVEPLDFLRIKPLAMRYRCSVIATYVDPFRSGHRFLIDVALWNGAKATLFPEYRLWRGATGATAFAPAREDGDWLSLSNNGLHVIPTAGSDQIAIIAGVARGQALLHQRIYGGTPFATPLPGNDER